MISNQVKQEYSLKKSYIQLFDIQKCFFVNMCVIVHMVYMSCCTVCHPKPPPDQANAQQYIFFNHDDHSINYHIDSLQKLLLFLINSHNTNSM